MTPTDVAGYIRLAPILLVLCCAFLALTAMIEETEVGRRWADKIIDWILGE